MKCFFATVVIARRSRRIAVGSPLFVAFEHSSAVGFQGSCYEKVVVSNFSI